jgi:glyoxylase-like metal-dependent hydrolase (beta-lactamase superfamily II)
MVSPSFIQRPKTWRHNKVQVINIHTGHADHYLGVPIFQKRFPGVRAVATAATIEHMKQQNEPQFFNSFWGAFFPNNQLAEAVLAEALPENNKFELEGHELEAIHVGHTDTFDTSVLWVPSIKLVCAGDVVYGEVHMYLVEANTEAKQNEWLRAIEKVKALGPEIVVAGHKRDGGIDGTWWLDESIRYIKDFQALRKSGMPDAKALFEAMMEKHGKRVNSHALLGGCGAAFKRSSHA